MSWLLDTCVISEATKKSPAPKVLDWLSRQNESSLYLSVLTLGELEKGAARLPEGPKRARIENWLRKDLWKRFHGRILTVDEEIALNWGRIQAAAESKGKTLPTLDSLIAATGITHELIVVTRDTQDMRGSGARIFDPWN